MKDEWKNDHLDMLKIADRDPSRLLVYTDGSLIRKDNLRCTGWGFSLRHMGNTHPGDNGALGGPKSTTPKWKVWVRHLVTLGIFSLERSTTSSIFSSLPITLGTATNIQWHTRESSKMLNKLQRIDPRTACCLPRSAGDDATVGSWS